MLQILDDDRLLNKINPADVHEVEQTLENAIRAGLSWDKLERASIEVAYTGNRIEKPTYDSFLELFKPSTTTTAATSNGLHWFAFRSTDHQIHALGLFTDDRLSVPFVVLAETWLRDRHVSCRVMSLVKLVHVVDNADWLELNAIAGRDHKVAPLLRK